MPGFITGPGEKVLGTNLRGHSDRFEDEGLEDVAEEFMKIRQGNSVEELLVVCPRAYHLVCILYIFY